ncbi:hydroxysqualene dehydroxylase [Microvirga antarctica]|uniref:hydroxysqualene dehydroxylase n=1 Tax=Microvirga antarctica TaxID=2819233 RepID=UPI001B306CB1|nr:FAD-dependent oxidoreductase [Microvirga antarctica]
MVAHTHIVGAGVAGLSAALAASRSGDRVTLYEAAPQAGGRCRTLFPPDGFHHDNGTHVLFTGNRAAIRLLDEVGARNQWIAPEPAGLPLYDGLTGVTRHAGLQPLSWRHRNRRPPGLTLADIPRFARLFFSVVDRPVGQIFEGSQARDTFIEPLTVAILNTPMAQASAKRLRRGLWRLALPGAARLLVAQSGLTADLVEPALQCLSTRQVRFLPSHRLRAVETDGRRATRLRLSDSLVALGPEDRVILALQPQEIRRLLPWLTVPTQFEPILNVHFRLEGLVTPRLIGLTGGLAQWMLVRADHVSVTVSAAGTVIDSDTDVLAADIWREISPVLIALGIDAGTGPMPASRLVKERRATISQCAGPLPQPPVRPLTNLTLAGDWIGSLPATIESAVIAGERAVAALGRRLWRTPVRAAQATTTEEVA